MVEFRLPGDIARIGKGRHTIVHEPADMVTMHMGEDDDIDLVGHIPRIRQRGCRGGGV